MGSNIQVPSPVITDSLEKLLEDFQDSKRNQSAIDGDKSCRAKLLAASKKLTAALEEPDDAVNYAQFYVSHFEYVLILELIS